MARQHFAQKTGKPNFKSHKHGQKKKRTKQGNPSSTPKKATPIALGGSRTVDTTTHQSACTCVPCLIARGDRENQERIQYSKYFR